MAIRTRCREPPHPLVYSMRSVSTGLCRPRLPWHRSNWGSSGYQKRLNRSAAAWSTKWFIPQTGHLVGLAANEDHSLFLAGVRIPADRGSDLAPASWAPQQPAGVNFGFTVFMFLASKRPGVRPPPLNVPKRASLSPTRTPGRTASAAAACAGRGSPRSRRRPPATVPRACRLAAPLRPAADLPALLPPHGVVPVAGAG